MMKLSGRHTKCVLIRGHHACAGITLQQKSVIHGVEEAAAGHHSQGPLDAIRAGAEPQELLLELSLQDVRYPDAKIADRARQELP